MLSIGVPQNDDPLALSLKLGPICAAIRSVDIYRQAKIGKRLAADVRQRHPPEPPVRAAFVDNDGYGFQIAVRKLDVGGSDLARPSD